MFKPVMGLLLGFVIMLITAFTISDGIGDLEITLVLLFMWSVGLLMFLGTFYKIMIGV